MKKMLIVVICVLLLISIMLFCLLPVFLFPQFFANSIFLSENENDEIKNLVLSAIKDRYSYFSSNVEDIYDEQYSDKIIQLYDPNSHRSVICIIDYRFMNTVESYDETTYKLKVKMYYPIECYHEFRITKLQSGYIITYWELDI